MITLRDVQAAAARIAPYIVRTPLLRIPALDGPIGTQVYLKFEGFQPIGSFKLRGAMNKALSLSPQELAQGLVCASSGNHAQGVAYAARALGTRAVIVMPTTVNPVKLQRVNELGGEAILEGTLASERDAKVQQLQAEHSMVNIHPFADPMVAAGQGTIALEVLEDLPDASAIVAPIGGGGLISGIATAVKGISPATRVIGAEPAGAARYSASQAAGTPVSLPQVNTIADGTRTDRANPDNFQTIQARVDQLCTASDDAIRQAMKLVFDCAKLLAEPSSVLPLAAALDGTLAVRPEEKVVFVLSGGNVDPALATQILAL